MLGVGDVTKDTLALESVTDCNVGTEIMLPAVDTEQMFYKKNEHNSNTQCLAAIKKTLRNDSLCSFR